MLIKRKSNPPNPLNPRFIIEDAALDVKFRTRKLTEPILNAEKLNGKAMPILSTLVYCLENDRVLLMRRNKEPNLGLWVAPGGKVEAGESPYDCAVRELREETGLKAEKLRFRGLVTEVSPQPDWQWMLFLYVTTDFSGELNGDQREGEFRWWSLVETDSLSLPQSDRIFFPKVIDFTQPFYEAKYVYNDNLDLVEVIEQ